MVSTQMEKPAFHSTRRMAELHIVEARRAAFDLFAFSSTIYPQEWKAPLSEKIMMAATGFAAHAYRVQELCRLKSEKITGTSVTRYSGGNVSDLVFEDNYHTAINKLRHAKELVFGWSQWDGTKVFLSSDTNLTALYLTINPRFKDEVKVSIFGVSFVFLTEIIPRIKKRYPTYQF